MPGAVAEQLQALGAPTEIVARWAEVRGADDRPFDVLACAWPTLELFLLVSTQWRFAGMDGVPTGLDYAAVEAAARVASMSVGREAFADLRAMEAAALDEWAGQRK